MVRVEVWDKKVGVWIQKAIKIEVKRLLPLIGASKTPPASLSLPSGEEL